MVKIIAEIGSVHDGSYGNAKSLIKAVADAGAWGVKFQHHIANQESTDYAPNPTYFTDESRKDYFNRIAFTRGQWEGLYKLAKDNSLQFIVSPFSIKSLEELLITGVDIIKVASGEVTNTRLLKEVYRKNIKAILSSGMSTMDELKEACDVLGESLLCLMQCTSEYPCKPENVGLNNIKLLAELGDSEPGFSDHTIGSVASILAVGEGAEYIEKHVTFSQKMYGSDAKHSMEINEFHGFINDLKTAYTITKSVQNKDESALKLSTMKSIFEKSLVYANNLKKSHILQEGDFSLKKPGDGLPSNMLETLIGKRLLHSVQYDAQVKLTDFGD